MKWRFWRSWGIAARLLAVAVLPASVMFIAVTGTLYVTARGDVHRDVAERGRLIATALSQSSQYGLVSGNVDYLRTTLHQVLHADPSIVCISISNVQRKVMASECQPRPFTQSSVYDMPVRIESLPDTEQFEPPSSNGAQPRTDTTLRTVGHVRVTVSATPIFEARRQALMLAFALVLGAAIASCLIGMWLAGRLRQTLGSVMGALRSIRTGHFDIQLEADRPGELGELQRTILQMAGTLEAARHDLEQQVISRTKELQEAVKRIQQADTEKRRLITHSNARVEEDRRRVALDIHDHLGAALISVRLEAAALIAKAQTSGDEETAKGARRIAATAESLYASTRDIVKSLRPEVIDTLGLAGAVEEMVRGHDKVHPRCRFAFSEDLGLTKIPGALAMPAYRVVQEALNNIVKHADATQVSVHLGLSQGKQQLNIEVKDNGKGFDTSTSNLTGLGLIGMRERVASVGGEFCISSPRGQGTTIYVTLPLAVENTH